MGKGEVGGLGLKIKHLKKIKYSDIQRGKMKIDSKDYERLYPITGGGEKSLKDFSGQNLVIYFYPKDHTPGCTQEGADFTKLYQQFLKLGTQIVGVSRDSIVSHESFKKKQAYSFDFFSDPDERLCKTFKVLERVDDSKNRLIRSTFVLDKGGQVIYENRSVKVTGHAEEVLSFIQSS